MLLSPAETANLVYNLCAPTPPRMRRNFEDIRGVHPTDAREAYYFIREHLRRILDHESRLALLEVRTSDHFHCLHFIFNEGRDWNIHIPGRLARTINLAGREWVKAIFLDEQEECQQRIAARRVHDAMRRMEFSRFQEDAMTNQMPQAGDIPRTEDQRALRAEDFGDVVCYTYRHVVEGIWAEPPSPASLEAEERSFKLLRENLNDHQLNYLDTTNRFHVQGSDTGRIYSIHSDRRNFNIECPRTGFAYCVVPAGSLPRGDVLLAQKIGLETNEFRTLSKANKIPIFAKTTCQRAR